MLRRALLIRNIPLRSARGAYCEFSSLPWTKRNRKSEIIGKKVKDEIPEEPIVPVTPLPVPKRLSPVKAHKASHLNRTDRRTAGILQTLDPVDAGIARELRNITEPTEVLAHWHANMDDYDTVNLTTAVHKIAAASGSASGSALSGVANSTTQIRPWKREPVHEKQLSALVSHTLSSLRESFTMESKLSRWRKEMEDLASSGDREAALELKKAEKNAISFRTVADAVYSLSRMNRCPQSLLHEASVTLRSRTKEATPADIAQLTYAFSRSNTRAPHLFNAISKEVVERMGQFKDTELSSLLLSYTSLKTAAPEMFAAATDRILSRREQQRTITPQILANTATALVRGLPLDEELPPRLREKLEAEGRPSSHAEAAARGLELLAPRIERTARKYRVPGVEPAFTAQGLATTAWAYSQALLSKTKRKRTVTIKHSEIADQALAQQQIDQQQGGEHVGNGIEEEIETSVVTDATATKVLSALGYAFRHPQTLATATPIHLTMMLQSFSKVQVELSERLQRTLDAAFALSSRHDLPCKATSDGTQAELSPIPDSLAKEYEEYQNHIQEAQRIRLLLHQLALPNLTHAVMTASIRILDPASQGLEAVKRVEQARRDVLLQDKVESAVAKSQLALAEAAESSNAVAIAPTKATAAAVTEKKMDEQQLLKQKAKLGELSSEEILAMQDDMVADMLLEQLNKSPTASVDTFSKNSKKTLVEPQSILDEPDAAAMEGRPDELQFLQEVETPPPAAVQDDLVITHNPDTEGKKYNPLSYAHSVALVTPFSMYDIAQLADSLSTIAPVVLAQAHQAEANYKLTLRHTGEKPVFTKALQVAMDEVWAKLADKIGKASEEYILHVKESVAPTATPFPSTSSYSSRTTNPPSLPALLPKLSNLTNTSSRKTGLEYNPLAPSSLSTLAPSNLADLALAASLAAPRKHAARILHSLATAFTYSDRDFWRRATGSTALPYQLALLENFTPSLESGFVSSPNSTFPVSAAARDSEEAVFLREAAASEKDSDSASDATFEAKSDGDAIPSFDEEPTWESTEIEARRRSRTFYKAPSVPQFRLRGERADGPPVPVFRLPGETPAYEGLSVAPGDLPKLAGGTNTNWTARIMHRISTPDLAKLSFAYSLAFPSVTSMDDQGANGNTSDVSLNSPNDLDASFSLTGTEDSVKKIRNYLRNHRRLLSEAQLELLPSTWTLPGGPFYGEQLSLTSKEASGRLSSVLNEAGFDALYANETARHSTKKSSQLRLANGLPSFQRSGKDSNSSKQADSLISVNSVEGVFASGHLLGQICSTLAQREELPLIKAAPLLQFLSTRDYSILFQEHQPSKDKLTLHSTSDISNKQNKMHAPLQSCYSFTALPHASLASILATRVQSELRKAQGIADSEQLRRKGINNKGSLRYGSSVPDEQQLPRPSKLRLPFLALNNYVVGFGSSLDGILAQVNLPGVIAEAEKQSASPFSSLAHEPFGSDSEKDTARSTQSNDRMGLNHIFERQKNTYDVLLLLLDEASRRMGTYQAAQQTKDKKQGLDPMQAMHILQFGATVASSVIPLVLNPLEVAKNLVLKETMESRAGTGVPTDLVNETLLPGLVLGDPKAWAIATLGYTRANNAIRQEQKKIHRGFVDQDYDKGLALEMKRLEAAKKHAQLVRASGLFVAAMSNFIESDDWEQCVRANSSLQRNPLRKKQLLQAESAITEAAQLLKKAFA